VRRRALRRRMSDATTTVAALRDRVRAFVRERDWEGYHNLKDLATALSVEASELLELFLWRPAVPASEMGSEDRAAVADEIADVVIYGLHIANALSIDLSDAVTAKVARSAEKYPVERFRGRARGPVPGGPR